MKKKLLALFLTGVFCSILINSTASAAQYTIKSSDTMWKIAQNYGITLQELLDANPQIADSNNIWEGLIITVPGSSIYPNVPSVPASARESLTYLYAGTPASYMRIIDTSNSSLTTVCPDYFDIDLSGNLLITPSNKINTEFINEMHIRGVKVTPFISNHWERERGNIALNNAEALSTQVAEVIEKYNLDGINIDIENVNEQYRQAYTNFTRLLREKLPSDKLVTVAVAANPNGWNTGWHGSYDYKALSDYSDYLMIMAYDESYFGGEAGPISSADFFNGSIDYAVKQGVPKSKIVTGIPFFGRFWKKGQTTGGSGITAADVEFLITNYQSEKHYDEITQSANVTITISQDDPLPKIWGGQTLTAGTYKIWYDDLRATQYKLEQINKYNIRGVGNWALGQENTETWRFYVDALNGNFPLATEQPTLSPTLQPTLEPTLQPTLAPTLQPTSVPTLKPTFVPTLQPTFVPTLQPTAVPTLQPTLMPIINTSENVINTLSQIENTKTFTDSTELTRGEVVSLLSEITYVKPELGSETFSDTANHWSKGWINAFKRRGIIRSDDGKFRPNDKIRKDELAVILERILVLPDTIDFHTISFKDVRLEEYPYNAISKLYYFDVMEGENKNFYRPEDSVTVREMANILEKIAKFEYPMNPDQHRINHQKMSKPNSPPNPDDKPVIQPR